MDPLPSFPFLSSILQANFAVNLLFVFFSLWPSPSAKRAKLARLVVKSILYSIWSFRYKSTFHNGTEDHRAIICYFVCFSESRFSICFFFCDCIIYFQTPTILQKTLACSTYIKQIITEQKIDAYNTSLTGKRGVYRTNKIK